jgi:phosphatidylserine/phosphatidylglycerophosphate/cardiolipin synthase-like enzyme
LHDTFLFGEQSIDAYLLPDKEKKALCHLVDLIDQSRKKIFVAIFTLTHPDLVEALIRAKKRGVGVKVAIDAYNAGGASKKAVLQLKAENIPIYVSQGWQLFHHKWALIDHHLVLGSANWTRAAFEKNRECLIFLSPLKKEQKKFFHNIKRSIVKKNGTDTKKTADSPSIFSNLSCKRSWDFIYSSAA